MGGRGSSGGFSVGETIVVSGYSIRGGSVTSPSGRSQSVDSYRELTATERRQQASAISAAGINDPVVAGRMILPRAVADSAINQRQRERVSLSRNVPGLPELRAARNYDQSQQESFSRSVYGGSGRLTGNPNSNTYASLAKRYPRAAAYLRAESWSTASNDVKASAGRNAMNAIASGKSYKAAIREMEERWRRHSRRTD